MNAVEILLRDLTGHDEACRWTTGANDTYVLTVDNEVVVNIHESAPANLVSFYTSPGYLWGADWLNELKTHWRVDTVDPDGEPDVAQTLTVDPATGVVLLIRTWPRERLDSVSFGRELARSVELNRFWSELLPDAPQPQSGQGDDR